MVHNRPDIRSSISGKTGKAPLDARVGGLLALPAFHRSEDVPGRRSASLSPYQASHSIRRCPGSPVGGPLAVPSLSSIRRCPGWVGGLLAVPASHRSEDAPGVAVGGGPVALVVLSLWFTRNLSNLRLVAQSVERAGAPVEPIHSCSRVTFERALWKPRPDSRSGRPQHHQATDSDPVG